MTGLRSGEHFQSVSAEPAPALRGAVLGYRGFRIALDRPRTRLELPSGSVSLLLLLDGGLQLRSVNSPAAARMSRSFLSGLHSAATLAVHSGRLHGIDVTLTPTGAYQLLAQPMADCANAFVELEAVLGAEAQRLSDQLHGLPDWPARFALLDRWLIGRLAAGPAPAPQIRWAHRQVTLDQPTGALVEVAEAVGWTERHLRSRFRQEVGLAPKAVARVARLQLALRLHEQGVAWSLVAAHCGFHDQAHLSKEIRAMTGLPPTELAALRGSADTSGTPVDRLPARVTSLVLGS